MSNHLGEWATASHGMYESLFSFGEREGWRWGCVGCQQVMGTLLFHLERKRVGDGGVLSATRSQWAIMTLWREGGHGHVCWCVVGAVHSCLERGRVEMGVHWVPTGCSGLWGPSTHLRRESGWIWNEKDNKLYYLTDLLFFPCVHVSLSSDGYWCGGEVRLAEKFLMSSLNNPNCNFLPRAWGTLTILCSHMVIICYTCNKNTIDKTKK